MKKIIKKYFPFDANYYLRGGSWLTFGQAVLFVLAFITSIAMTNVFSPTEYGAYKYILSMTTLLALPSLTEMFTAVTRAVAQGNTKAVWAGFIAKVRFGLIGSFLATGVGIYYFLQGNRVYGIGFLLVGISIPFADAFGLYDAYLEGKQQFRESTVISLAIQLVYTIMLLAVIFFTRNILMVAITTIISLAILKAIAFVWLTRRYPILSSKDHGTEREVVHFGKHLSFMKGLNILSGSIYTIFLYHVAGAPALAMFFVAQGPLEQLRAFLNLGETLIIARFSDTTHALFTGRVFLKKLAPILAMVGVIVVSYIFASPFLFAWVFPKYVGAVIYSQWYATSLFITATNILLTSFLKARGNMRALHTINVIDIVVNLGAIIPAIYFFGIPGLIGGMIVLKLIEGACMAYFLFGASKQEQANAPVV